MSYRLLKNESVAEGLKRVAEEEISGAIRQLQSDGDLGRNIYEVRRRIKKLRAVLRLLQPPLGPIYIEENRRLRDLAHRFGPLRDLDVCLEVLEKFADQYKRKSTLNPYRRTLSEKRSILNSQTDWNAELAESLQALDAIRRRIDDWPLHGLTAEFLQLRLRKTHKKSRRAFDVAAETHTAEDFHELRKCVKRELNQCRLLNAPPQTIEPLKDLSQFLGDHHNLAVLSAALLNPSERFRGMIATELAQLESKILDLGCSFFHPLQALANAN